MWHLLAQSSGDEAVGAAVVGGMMMMYFIVFAVAYVVMALSLTTIAKKTGMTENLWMAWVPIANIILMVQIAELEMWWVIVSLLCGIAMIYVWMKIAEKRGKPNWTALLMLVPCVGFFVPLWIAYSD